MYSWGYIPLTQMGMSGRETTGKRDGYLHRHTHVSGGSGAHGLSWAQILTPTEARMSKGQKAGASEQDDLGGGGLVGTCLWITLRIAVYHENATGSQQWALQRTLAQEIGIV